MILFILYLLTLLGVATAICVSTPPGFALGIEGGHWIFNVHSDILAVHMKAK